MRLVFYSIIFIQTFCICTISFAAISIKDGRYKIVAVLGNSNNGLTGTVNLGSRSERIFYLEKSKWDKSLKSLVNSKIPLQLTGKIVGDHFTIQEPPKAYRLKIDKLLNDRDQFVSLDN